MDASSSYLRSILNVDDFAVVAMDDDMISAVLNAYIFIIMDS